MKIDWSFLRRGFALALAVLALVLAALALLLPRLFPRPPSGPLPPKPTIEAQSGILPAAPVGLQEWARYRGEAYRLVGSGFLFRSEGGEVVGATTAHSLSMWNCDRVLERVALGIAGQEGFVVEAGAFHGSPGKARLLGLDFTGDYVLLKVEEAVDLRLVLEPDPRGSPQAGESVVLYSGLGSGGGGLRTLGGTVLSADEGGAWLVMDTLFEPAMMSGSPVVSAHTGKVVGMAMAATQRDDMLLLGIHPIGSLVDKAEGASVQPILAETCR